jgi:hypothetical protein
MASQDCRNQSTLSQGATRMSNLKVNTINDASGGNTAKLYGVSMRDGGTGWVNRIINGDMRIDQRNAGAAVTVTAGSVFAVDRFNVNVGASTGVIACQQVADAPSGFTNSLRLTISTAVTASASQFLFARQVIEGNNIADIGWGTASAQAVTVSFWVKVSIPGNYSLFAINSAEDRSYVSTFTVSAANTWEFKTVTIPGDTSGTWLTNNSNGIRFGFDLGSGSNFQGTANSWNSGWKQRTSGTVNFCQTSGATFQFTGVQLEAGSVATPFERRDYGRELQMCQRYYWQGNISNGVAYFYGLSADGMGPTCSFPVTMRATPSSASIVTAPIYDNCTSFDVTWNANGLTHRLNASTGGPKAYRAYGGTYSANAEL